MPFKYPVFDVGIKIDSTQLPIHHKKARNRKSDLNMRLCDCYQLLHLQEDCSDLEVRSAYRKFAKLMHPDKKMIENESARLKFSQLNEAYRSIIGHRKRLNKIKFEIINEYEKQEKYCSENLVPTYQQMEFNFDEHMRSLDLIQQRLNSMMKVPSPI